ncbi:MAG: 50S ribosomal protein L30 [Pseudomonadota bacterium]|nr:50S ribosomal protein L30 [Pseudomonadota bacterium]
MEKKRLKLTLVRSVAGRLKNHQACAKGLGLRRMHHSVVVDATPENLGMVRNIGYLLKVEEV